MTQLARAQVLMWFCLALSVFLLVVSFLDGPTWTTALLAVVAVLSGVAVVDYRRRARR
jgi:hypothetical protein